MPSAEYQAAMGGSLKMKGVKDASVAKKKHKKKNKDKSEDKKTPAAAGNVLSEDTGTPLADDVRSQSAGKADGEGEDEKRLEQKEEQDETPLGKEIGSATSKKTEAELRHEERRRKRVSGLNNLAFHPSLYSKAHIGCVTEWLR